VQNSLADRRMSAVLLGLLALVALGLTAVGIYGVISFLAAQRIHEMSIRLALGAQGWQVAKLIVGQGVRLAAIGALVGAAGSVWAGWLLRAHLYETQAADPVTIAGAAGLLLVTAAAACVPPALRVTSSTRLAGYNDRS
jgi:ABC-type antimicrobial peptide transport system permease subunit